MSDNYNADLDYLKNYLSMILDNIKNVDTELLQDIFTTLNKEVGNVSKQSNPYESIAGMREFLSDPPDYSRAYAFAVDFAKELSKRNKNLTSYMQTMNGKGVSRLLYDTAYNSNQEAFITGAVFGAAVYEQYMADEVEVSGEGSDKTLTIPANKWSLSLAAIKVYLSSMLLLFEKYAKENNREFN